MKFVAVFVSIWVCGTSVWADLPLTVDELIAEKGKLKLDFTLSYANADRQNLFTADPVIIQTGPTSFITLPALVGESISNSDTVVATVGIRYGLTANAEMYSRVSTVGSNLRTSMPGGGITQNNESGFADAWLGLNYQFKKDDKTPGLLGFAEVALRENHRRSSASFKSAMFGFITYKAIDPVVFSLTGAYRFNQTRQDGSQSYKPGNLLLLNPGVAFAVNDRVTLTTGAQWTRRATDRFDGQKLSFDRTATDLLLGVGYGFAKGNTLNTTFKVNASGRSGAEMRVNWLFGL